MPRGQPDYGLMTQTPVASGISDPGEAAARLGSINVYDRRGWTVWMDDFEAPVLKWTGAIALTGEFPVLSSATSWMGAQCVYFDAPTGISSRSMIIRMFPLVRRGRIGVEVFVCGTTEMPGYLWMQAEIDDGVNSYIAQWRLDTTNRNLFIVSGGINRLIATNVYGQVTNHNFLPIKLVIDMDTDFYTRLMVGADEYDISAYPMDFGGLAALSYVDIRIGVYGTGAPIDCSGYADNFILTQNEP